jgi:hypothetical protein
MRNYLYAIFTAAMILLITSACSQKVSFSSDVKPILDTHCLKCHDGKGEGSAKSEFNVVDYNSVLKGTKFGAVVVPGDSSSSTLYRMISHQTDPKIHMPPHKSATGTEDIHIYLTRNEIETIQNWIDQGALDN